MDKSEVNRGDEIIISVNGRVQTQPKPVDYGSWPTWAKALKLLSTPQDRGVGDVLARTIGHENSEAFKHWYKSTFGRDCGCNGRQERWNKLYPL